MSVPKSLSIAWLLICGVLPAFGQTLGTTNLLEANAAGSDSVVLSVPPANPSWTASRRAAWLHLSATPETDSGSTNLVFTFDANDGGTRVGTLIIAGQTLTVTQAGATYVAANPVTALVPSAASAVNFPTRVAVDGVGNVYIGDTMNNRVAKWNVAENTLSTLADSGFNQPWGVAVDGSGNVYIADFYNNAIKEWNVATSNVTTLVSSGLGNPRGLAVDGAGNVYFADFENSALKEWTAANSNVITLVSAGLSYPEGVAVDGAGNVYIADTVNNAIKEWNAASSNVTTLVASGLNLPWGVAVDGAGNVYLTDSDNSAIKKWTAASQTVTTLVSSGLFWPYGVAVDGAGNVYIADTINNAIKEVPHAFVDPTPRIETAAAGSDTLPVVLPAAENLTGPFAPVSDSSWLIITGTANGLVSFSFSANTAILARTANITLLGQTIPVTQRGPVFTLGTSNLLEGASAGSDSVVLAVTPMNSPWTATANASWLHLSTTSQNGLGSTNVIFTFDANPGGTRTGTLTLGDQTFSVTQAGSTYVAANPVTTLVSGLNLPDSLAVDGAGNVYFPTFDYVYFPSSRYIGSIKEWLAASNAVMTNVDSVLDYVVGLAVDSAGNIYISDYQANAIKEWVATNNTIITLVSSGLLYPESVAVDSVGNVYIADYGNNAIKEWVASNGSVITLAAGLNQPTSVSVDAAGNVYFTDAGNNAIKKWSAASSSVATLISSGLSGPTGVAVDGAGNLYIAEVNGSSIYKWIAASNTLTTLSSWGWNDGRLAVDRAGNVYVTDWTSMAQWLNAFVDPSPKLETADAGSDTLATVLPAAANLSGPFSPASDSAWLTISGNSNGVVSFSFTPNTDSSVRIGHISLLGQTITVTQTGPAYALGTANLLVGPSAGSDSVVLSVAPFNFPWTAVANAPWLHLADGNQMGSGSTNVIFAFDANSGTTRTGTLTIAGQTLSVTQAGATYSAASPLTSLVSTGLAYPEGVAVDTVGNVYIADTHNNAIKEWMRATNYVTTRVSSGLNGPFGVAVDGAGNAYIADTFNNAIKEWSAASNSVVTLVSSGLYYPQGVALDGNGNVYIADTFNNAIEEWLASNNTVTTLVALGVNHPQGVSVDAAGNVYVADYFNNAIDEWTAGGNAVSSLVSAGLPYPTGVAVDGSGNVFMADTINNAIEEWTAADNTVTTLVSLGVNHPQGVAVDGAGNVYIADTYNNAVEELPRAFVDPTPKFETAFVGSDALPQVLPDAANLTGPFAPFSDSAWLTITGSANGVVSFAFTANTTGINRTANITLLGQTNVVTQMGPIYSLGTPNLLEGVGAGSDSVVLSVAPAYSVWTAATDASWLHLSAANQSGAGSANVIFTFDANSGPTRAATLTVAGLTLAVTQAGSTYVAANPFTTLVSSGLNGPRGVAVDGTGNVYIADTFNNEIKEWSAAGNTVTTLVAAGLNSPMGVAVDGVDNVYIADTVDNAVKEWMATNNTVTTLVSSGLDYPQGVAVDATGNVYIADSFDRAIKEWTVSSNDVTTLASSGLSNPLGVAVDGAGNVYIADTFDNTIEEWMMPGNSLFPLVSSGLYYPYGVAVDGSGNVFIADTDHSAVKEWIAANNTVSTLVASGLYAPSAVAVDGADNVYIADTYNNAIAELPHAFVDPTPKAENPAAGSDVLPAVLPANLNLTGPWAPTSDSAWLTITGSANGVVNFAFTANASSASRTGKIILLGQSVPITQAAVSPPILAGFTILANGAFQFGFTNNQGASFSVLTSSSLSLPLIDWRVIGTCTNNGGGQYTFTDTSVTNSVQHFYRVSSP